MIRLIWILSLFLLTFTNAEEPITPIPTKVEVDKKKADLGKELFFDKRLSKDDSVSCFSCHKFNLGGADNLKFSVGVEGKLGNINAPTVFNSVYNFVQFWDGRARTLHAQVFGPLENPNEMDMNVDELIEKLNKTEYKAKFKKVYKNGLTKNNLADAIAEYEKTLITPNSPFDRYLRGDQNAISEEAKRGYQLFKDQGCIACHHGRNVGGNLYAKFGVVEEIESVSKGRYEVTNNEEDLYYFKVPSLRNVTLTFPYLHDGRFDNLKETIKFMSHYQLGKSLTESEVGEIVLFLESLTGELYDYNAEE